MLIQHLSGRRQKLRGDVRVYHAPVAGIEISDVAVLLREGRLELPAHPEAQGQALGNAPFVLRVRRRSAANSDRWGARCRRRKLIVGKPSSRSANELPLKVPEKLSEPNSSDGAKVVDRRITHRPQVDAELQRVLALDPGNIVRVLEGLRTARGRCRRGRSAKARSRAEIEPGETAVVAGVRKSEPFQPRARTRGSTRKRKRLRRSQIAVAKAEFVDELRRDGIAVGEQEISIRPAGLLMGGNNWEMLKRTCL